MTPRVVCVMLAAGRPAMVARALRSFQAQTYERRELLILDSGSEPLRIPLGDPRVHLSRLEPDGRSRPIGELRNLANAFACGGALDAQVIAHWDSDDWYHPERLAEQVALLTSDLHLKASGADCVGYRELLFWRRYETYDEAPDGARYQNPAQEDDEFGEAWLYRNPNPAYGVGASLLYWRKTWEKRPFPMKHAGEDTEWLLRVKCVGESALLTRSPRMIASIHGGNTCSQVQPGAKEWTRMPSWDNCCRETMKL